MTGKFTPKATALQATSPREELMQAALLRQFAENVTLYLDTYAALESVERFVITLANQYKYPELPKIYKTAQRARERAITTRRQANESYAARHGISQPKLFTAEQE